MKKKWISVFYSLYLLLTVLVFCPALSSAKVEDAESATHGTDASRYYIVETYQFPGFKLIQFELPVLSIYSYMLESEGEALVVDPCRDISVFLDVAKKEGVKILCYLKKRLGFRRKLFHFFFRVQFQIGV